jgi:hypothetical protein
MPKTFRRNFADEVHGAKYQNHCRLYAVSVVQIYSQLARNGVSPVKAWLAVAWFLVDKGANLNHKNRADRTPLDEVSQDSIRDLLIGIT